ncbi:MAG: glycosyltransferase family 4 protein [Opitutaceae bacterium]
MTDPPLLGAHLTDRALRCGARVIHWIQDIYPEIITAHLGQLTTWPLWPWRLKRNAAWQAAQASVTLSASMVATIAAAAPTIAPAIVPNWAPRELQVPAAAEAIATCRAKWGLADKCIVAYSGNLGRVHEFKTILAAAARLKNQPEIAFLFIGTGAHFDGLRSAATARQLKNISFLPPVSRENLAVALAATDIQLVTLNPAFTNLVYPSKLAGALAAGRPVLFVGPARGEIAQLLTAEDCGQAVSPGDDEALAAIITQWQLDLPRRRQLARKARAAYTKYFTLTQAVDRWVEILHRVAATVKG